MANKFQKSVLERLEQEAVRKKQNVKEKINTDQNKTPAVPKDINGTELKIGADADATNKNQPIPEETTPEPPAGTIEQPVIPDISGYLRRDTQRLAKNKTFYLDTQLIEAIKSTAKKQNVTDSKLVNDILRRVLGLQ